MWIHTLWSVNESLCCYTSIPYLDIIALIRWIKLISKSEHRRQCLDRHSVSLMICLPSIQLRCYFTVISPVTCRLTSPAHVISCALILSLLSSFIWCLDKMNPIDYSLFLHRGKMYYNVLYNMCLLEEKAALRIVVQGIGMSSSTKLLENVCLFFSFAVYFLFF